MHINMHDPAMDFTCDPAKAASNVRKHGVSLEEGASALLDPRLLSRSDFDTGEERHVVIGMSNRLRLLVVVYTLRGDIPHIISARSATKTEARHYA